jgi:hypothetical protein
VKLVRSAAPIGDEPTRDERSTDVVDHQAGRPPHRRDQARRALDAL